MIPRLSIASIPKIAPWARFLYTCTFCIIFLPLNSIGIMYEPCGINDPPLAPDAPFPMAWILVGLEFIEICLKVSVDMQVNAAPVSYNQG